MNGSLAQEVLFLCGLALPASLVAWTGVTLIESWLPCREDQPGWFRFLALRTQLRSGEHARDQEGAIILVTVTAVWALFNFPPSVALFESPAGWLGRAVAVAYFVVQGLFVLDLRRAIERCRRRTDTRDGTGNARGGLG
jgi:hypothetical protein